jgi:RNA polymerase sigma factor (sigma-70 family)
MACGRFEEVHLANRLRSTMQTTDFDNLMERVAAGSEEAIWQLAETYSPHIISVVRRSLAPSLRQKMDSADIVQTLWASILLRPAEFARFKTPEHLIAFLARATKNKVIDKARHYGGPHRDVSREVKLPAFDNPGCNDNADRLFSSDPTPSTIASIRERWINVVSSCSEQEQAILAMRRNGQSYDGIGLALSISRHKARRVIDHLVEQFVEAE